MQTISPYSYAAIIILIKLFAFTLYVPVHGENAAVTAAVAAGFSVIKLLSFIPLFIVYKRRVTLRRLSRVGSAFCATGAAWFLLVTVSAFATVLETIYPERFSQAGVTAIIFLVFAYVASLDMQSVSRTASILVWVTAAVLLIQFISMRSGVQAYRLNFYSENIGSEIASTIKNLSACLADYFVFFGLLPYLKSSPQKAAGIYIVFEILFSLIFFLTGGAVMGSFWSKSGYSFYTLSYTTTNSVVMRSDGIVLAVSAACLIVCGAALMIILKNAVKSIFPIKGNLSVLTGSAITLTAVSLALINAGISARKSALTLSILSAAVLLTGSIIAMCQRKKSSGQCVNV